MASSEVIKVYNAFSKVLEANPGLLSKLHTELSKIVSAAYNQSMNSDEGYCFKFTLPITAVTNLFSLLQIDPGETVKALATDWKFPAHAVMYNDPYYHILLLILYYGLKHKDDQLVNNALFILLQKIWNGRKYAYLKYCDKRIMSYVITHLVNKKHNVANYDSPLTLLKDYFVPTLLKKYGPEILKDPYRLRQLFMQCWARIDQMFIFNPITDIETGEKKAQGGLLPLYMKARQEGLYLSTKLVKSEDEEEPGFDQYSSMHNRDAIVTSTTDFITMNTKNQYPQMFIDEVNTSTKVSSKVIDQMLSALHNHNYYDIIHDALSLILSRTNINEKNDICRPEFMLNIKKNIISSKNNDDVRKVQRLLNMLADKIFEDSLKVDLNLYGSAQKAQICNVVLNGLVYNLKKYNCSAA